MLRTGENSLNFPSETPKVNLAPLQCLKPFPGEFFAVLDPPRGKTAGGVLLDARGDGWNDRHTEEVDRAGTDWEIKAQEAFDRIEESRKDPSSRKSRLAAHMASEIAMVAYERLQIMSSPEAPGAAYEERPDAYTVAKVGLGVPLGVGDRVMIAPYAARRFQNLFGVDDVCLIGREDNWLDITILLQSQLTHAWEPLANWIAVRVDQAEKPLAATRRTFLNSGVVLTAGPWAESQPGDHVALHRDRVIHRPDNSKWFATHYGPWDGDGVLLVREVDGDGVRRMLGRIEVTA